MYKRGTVILIPFPFTDLSGNKVRPALIISNGGINEDIVVVFITSQTKFKGRDLVSVAPDNLNGLKVPSKIVCGKIATLDVKIVLGEIGSISNAVQKKVDVALRTILDL